MSVIHGQPFPALLGYKAISATYSATVADYSLDCISNTFTLTLPDGTIFKAGRTYTIVNSGNGTITIACSAGQLINGASTQTLLSITGMIIQWTGSAWLIISTVLVSLTKINIGEALVNFATFSKVAEIDVTGQTAFLLTSNVFLQISGNYSDDVYAQEWKVAVPFKKIAGVGFSINIQPLIGTFKGLVSVKWSWTL